MQEPAHRNCVARMRPPHAVLFGRVLAGFRQQAWVGSGHNLRARFSQHLAEPGGGTGGINAHRPAGAAERDPGLPRLAMAGDDQADPVPKRLQGTG